MTEDIARLRAGIGELHALYRELLRAYAPANPAFERERIINETALLLDVICTTVDDDADAPTAHLADEACTTCVPRST